MKREDIEKAAKDYSIGKTYFRRNVLKEVDEFYSRCRMARKAIPVDKR